MFNQITGSFEFKAPDLDGYSDAWPELSEVVERIERYGADLTETSQRVRQLTDSGARKEAERKDTAAFAEAIQAGKKDPGTPHADKLEGEIAAAKRRRDALRVALSELGAELLATIERGRTSWLEDVREGLTGAQERLEEARQAARRAEAEVSRHKEIQAFLEDPQGYKPGRASKKPKESPKAKPPVFSVLGGRPSSEAKETTHALRVTRGGAA